MKFTQRVYALILLSACFGCKEYRAGLAEKEFNACLQGIMEQIIPHSKPNAELPAKLSPLACEKNGLKEFSIHYYPKAAGGFLLLLFSNYDNYLFVSNIPSATIASQFQKELKEDGIAFDKIPFQPTEDWIKERKITLGNHTKFPSGTNWQR